MITKTWSFFKIFGHLVLLIFQISCIIRFPKFLFADTSFADIGNFLSSFLNFFHFHQEALWFLLALCHKGGVTWYLRLLIFLPAILILPCASSSPAFHMMYSAYDRMISVCFQGKLFNITLIQVYAL